MGSDEQHLWAFKLLVLFFLNLCFYHRIWCYQTRCYCGAKALTDSHVTFHFQLLQNN